MSTIVQKLLQDYKGLQDIIAILGMDELSEEDKLTVSVKVWAPVTMSVLMSTCSSSYQSARLSFPLSVTFRSNEEGRFSVS